MSLKIFPVRIDVDIAHPPAGSVRRLNPFLILIAGFGLVTVKLPRETVLIGFLNVLDEVEPHPVTVNVVLFFIVVCSIHHFAVITAPLATGLFKHGAIWN